MPKRKKLAVDSSEEDKAVDSSEDEHDSDAPLFLKAPRTRKSKSKSPRDDGTTEEEIDTILVENSQAGLKTKTNDKGNEKKKEKANIKNKEKDKKKSKGKEKENNKDKSKKDKKGKGKELVPEERSDIDESGDENTVIVSESGGSLHGSDDEPGLSKWTKADQEHWQEEDVEEPGADLYVDIVVRWRWHPKFHYAQYRIKWEGFLEYQNTWEPIESFKGSDADDFWKDLEFEGSEKRPDKWNLKWKTLKKRLEAAGKDTEPAYETDSQMYDEDPKVRKEARRKKRRTIRLDRVEMKAAYRRRRLRDKAEEELKEKQREKEAEDKRRKRREEEEEAKRKEAGPSRSNKIIYGVKITQGGVSKPAAPRTATSTTSTTVRDVPVTANRPSAPDSSQMEWARLYVTEPDAKVKAERKKAKMDEDKSRFRPAMAVNEDNNNKPTVASSIIVAVKDNTEAKAAETIGSSPRSGASSAVRGGAKPRGSFRGQHNVKRKIPLFDPLSLYMGAPKAPSTTTKTVSSTTTSNPQVTSGGWDDDPTISSEPVVTTQQATSNEPTKPAVMQAPLPPALPRPLIRKGVDPRARPGMPSSAPSNGFANVPTSPFGLMSNTSPLHPAMSPMHPNQSPREVQSAIMSPAIDQKDMNFTIADEERAKKAIEQRWQMDKMLQERIRTSYNLLCPHPESDRELRRLLDSVIKVLGGGLITSIEPRHKEPNRNVTAWVPSARTRLTAIEIEGLRMSKIPFYEYESGAQEIWPAEKGKIVMYTLGALMIKLVEQISGKKDPHVWSVEEGTSIVIHPWQKTIIQQIIDLDKVEDFLRQVIGETVNVPDKGFDIVESAINVLEELEEVPSELTASYMAATDIPNVEQKELRQLTHIIDTEVSKTLHRLQYEWRLDRRMFELIMAKTRLIGREVPTAWTVM